MQTFGQKMRQAVADRGLRLDQLVKETGLPIEHLQALVCDDFARLPDDDIVENGLRCFAQLVGVESGEVIEDYRRERRKWLESGPTVKVAPPEPPEEAPMPRSGHVPAVVWALAVAVLAVVAFLWLRSPASGSDRLTPVEESPAVTETTPPVPPPAPRPAVQAAPVAPPVASAPARAETSGLSIADHGVGRDIIDHELVGESDRFAPGDRVWFWTRVEGGSPGDSIDHVWLHEGEESLRVPLRLGGALWRTQSYRTLSSGSTGRWTVEARDDSGRVLARREFVCAPTP